MKYRYSSNMRVAFLRTGTGIVWCMVLIGVNAQVVMPPGIMPHMEPHDPCKDIKNKTDFDMPKHKYMVVEHCLYYSLQRDIDTKSKQPNAIAMFPPPKSDADADPGNITMIINGITLQSLALYEPLKDLRIRGFMPVSWKDPRLVWDPKEWKISDMTVQTASHIWTPQLSSEKHDTALMTTDAVDYKKLHVSNTGNVSGLMSFSLQTFCDVDLHNFPSDVHTCCSQLEPTFSDNILNFNVASSRYYVDTRFIKNNGYQVDKVTLQMFVLQESTNLQLCVYIIRSNTTLQMELSLPMAICAILILFAPLFGSLKSQLQVKLFALLLQYLCLQFLTNKMTYLGNGSTPRVFRFYEFTIIMNLISLLLTAFVTSALRIDRSLPPAQSFTNISTLINKLCFCLSVADVTEDNQMAQIEEKKYARDWRSVFSAVHSLLMCTVVIVYLIGICVIYS